MDRLNRQPNIYADLPDVEKLAKVFGEYNHERKLIYPVAHSLKIKIHKTKCYFEKNPVWREESLQQPVSGKTPVRSEKNNPFQSLL